MNSLRLFLTTVFLMAPATVKALPTAFYNPATGNVKIWNHYSLPLRSISLLSPSGSLGDPNSLLAIPGAVFDRSEFPFAYTYRDFPVGLYDTGNTVVIGTPLSHLSLEYFSPT